MKIYYLTQLSSSKIQYDKNPPKFIIYIIYTTLILLVFLIILASLTYKTEVVRSSGILSSNNKVYIQSPIQGEIKNLYKKSGDYVKKGELIFEIDQIEIDSSIKSLEAKCEYIATYVNNYKILINALESIDPLDISKLSNPFDKGEFYLNYKSINEALINASASEDYTLEERRKNIIEQYLSSAYQSKFQYEYEYIGNKSQIEGYEVLKEQYKVYATTDGYLDYAQSIRIGNVIDCNSIGSISEKINDNNAVIECYISAEHRNFLRINQECEITISGLSQAKYGTINGVVNDISDDIIIDNDNNIFYKVHVKPNTVFIEYGDDNIKLMNGQVAEVRIKYESITWMTWILKKIGIMDK